MEGNPCLQFFATTEPQQKVKELQKVDHQEALRWESLTASEHSPGPIQPGEVACRQVTHPTFFDESGQLKPTAFDDVSNKGLSVDRWAFTSEAEITQRANARNAEWNANNPDKDPRTLHSIGYFAVDNLRALMVNEQRAFGVYDTALQTNRAHADVCRLVAGGAQIARSLRASLFEMVSYTSPIAAQE